MHDRFRLKGLQVGREKFVIGYIADKQLNLLGGKSVPDSEAVGQRLNRGQGLHAQFVVPLPAKKIVDNRNRVPSRGQVQRSCPTTVAISTQHADLHCSLRE